MSNLVEALGGGKTFRHEPQSVQEWVERIREGLPAASAFAFKDSLDLSNAQLGTLLGVSERTLGRLNPARDRLDAVAGDRLHRSARLFSMATEVLEDQQAAVRWLKAPQRALDGAVPLELAVTDVGARAVEALLGRMEHGVYT